MYNTPKSAWRSPLRAIKDRNDSEGEYEEDVMQMAWPFGAAEDRNLFDTIDGDKRNQHGGRRSGGRGSQPDGQAVL
ncbi:hypothetical protein [Streptomyces parvus]|uniref:hypothetical protein n=1 Tax=Streptomyces parvus TaxID=66428 RepID=UPI0035DF65B6